MIRKIALKKLTILGSLSVYNWLNFTTYEVMYCTLLSVLMYPLGGVELHIAISKCSTLPMFLHYFCPSTTSFACNLSHSGFWLWSKSMYCLVFFCHLFSRKHFIMFISNRSCNFYTFNIFLVSTFLTLFLSVFVTMFQRNFTSYIKKPILWTENNQGNESSTVGMLQI